MELLKMQLLKTYLLAPDVSNPDMRRNAQHGRVIDVWVRQGEFNPKVLGTSGRPNPPTDPCVNVRDALQRGDTIRVSVYGVSGLDVKPLTLQDDSGYF
jgi:hypothetical protein